MKRPLIAAGVVLVTVLGLSLPAGAGVDAHLVATPNPATTEDTITVSNEAGSSSTCQEPVLEEDALARPALLPLNTVYVSIDDPDGNQVFLDSVEPDSDGNWSVEVGPFGTPGTYTAFASCGFLDDEPLAGPARLPNFVYAPLDFEVLAVTPTTPAVPTTGTVPSSSTTNASTAAVTASPRFTG